MHPAPSVILFTVLSGLGFGMLAWLGFGYPDVTGWSAFIFFFIAFALAVGGLLASTLHLGNPKNALKAFSQWRSSWLSREGVCAVAALIIMGVYAAAKIFLGQTWMPIGIIGAVLSILTVFTTSMIYAQLKTVPRWNHWTTNVMLLTFAIAGGALMTGQVTVAIYGLAFAGIMQIITWALGDKRFGVRGSNIETATGLGHMGKVRQFEGPHTGTNYLMKEMVYVVARRHAMKLRVIALIFMAIIPVILLLISTSHMMAIFVVASHLFGMLAQRWLFFAEAEHVVGLYYDKR